jgi:hypothetical protein
MTLSYLSTRPRSGYVYVLSNPAMPGVVKIGRSHQGASARAKSLSGTSVPTAFVVEFEILCLDAEKAEDRAHRYANKSRVNTSREFFGLSVRDAVGHVIEAAWEDWQHHQDEQAKVSRTPLPALPPRVAPEVGLVAIAKLRAALAEDDK